jgi:hypothetical protein
VGLFSDPAEDWTRTAYALGLPLCQILKPFTPEEPVHAIQRRLGPPGQMGGHPDQMWISGERRGVCFVAGGRTVVRHTSEGTETERFMHWMAEIDPPLWMGLSASLRQGGLLTDLFNVNTRQVNAWDPGRLQQLFAVRANDGYDPWDLLSVAVQARLEVTVDDHSVRFERSGYALDPQMVGQALDGVTMIAERLKLARARLGPAQWELDAAAAWGAFATRYSMQFDRERLRVSGPLEGSKAEVRILGGAVPRTRVRVRFPNPLGLGLYVGLGQVSGIAKFFGAQDIEVGDPAFDQAFVVRGGPESMVRQVLHAQMRAELLGFASRGARVEIQDDRLEAWLPGMLFKGQELDELLMRAMAVVRGFWRR